MMNWSGRWNVYISPFTGLAMYVKEEADKNASAIVRDITAHYYGRPRYRINVKPKSRFVHYSRDGEHDGLAYVHYEDYRPYWETVSGGLNGLS
jgi:hypothetical protein